MTLEIREVERRLFAQAFGGGDVEQAKLTWYKSMKKLFEQGNVRAGELAYERAFGRVPQTVEPVAGEGGGRLMLLVVDGKEPPV